MRTIHKITNSILRHLEKNGLLKVTKYEEIGYLYSTMIKEAETILEADTNWMNKTNKEWLEYEKRHHRIS